MFDTFYDITEIYKQTTNNIHIGRLVGLFLDHVIEQIHIGFLVWASSILVVLLIWI
jgi:hypothetical protein